MELIRELGASFGVCIVGGTVSDQSNESNEYIFINTIFTCHHSLRLIYPVMLSKYQEFLSKISYHPVQLNHVKSLR